MLVLLISNEMTIRINTVILRRPPLDQFIAFKVYISTKETHKCLKHHNEVTRMCTNVMQLMALTFNLWH